MVTDHEGQDEVSKLCNKKKYTPLNNNLQNYVRSYNAYKISFKKLQNIENTKFKTTMKNFNMF